MLARDRRSVTPLPVMSVGDAGFSNADNMAVVGLLSTQVLHHRLIGQRDDGDDGVPFRTVVHRVA